MTAVAILACGAARCEETGAPEDVNERLLLLPFGNPIDEFQPNTMARHSLIGLSARGSRALLGRAGLNGNVAGRGANALLTAYLVYAADYYSHEVAHSYLNRGKRRLFIDLSNWDRGVPEYVEHARFDVWDEEEYAYYQTHPYDRKAYEWMLLMNQGGLSQDRFNARIETRLASASGVTGLSGGIAFLSAQFTDVEYLARWRNEPIELADSPDGWYYDCNDVTGYVDRMRDLGVEISRDRWLAFSAFFALASGQTWNSVRSIWRYLSRGDEATGNIELQLGKRLRIAPPNFYLFSTIRGLYVDTETHVGGVFRDGDGLLVSLGAGLDALGAARTGRVDRVRAGASYRSLPLPLSLSFRPFLYLDFASGFRQVGHAAGAVVTTPSYREFFLSAEVQHSRGDMIEQVIMSRDEGFRFFAYLGYAL